MWILMTFYRRPKILKNEKKRKKEWDPLSLSASLIALILMLHSVQKWSIKVGAVSLWPVSVLRNRAEVTAGELWYCVVSLKRLHQLNMTDSRVCFISIWEIQFIPLCMNEHGSLWRRVQTSIFPLMKRYGPFEIYHKKSPLCGLWHFYTDSRNVAIPR